MKRFAILSNIIIVLTLLFIFVACGDDPEPTPQPTPTEAQTTSAVTSTTGVTASDTVAPTSSNSASTTVTNITSTDAITSPAASVQLTDANSVVVEVASIDPLTATASNTSTTATTITGGVSTSIAEASASTSANGCTTQLHLDLSGFPDAANLPTVLGCAKNEATLDPVAINEFGKGPNYDRFMLWFGSDKQIYVLLPNQTWLAYTDTWSEGEPEIACNPTNGAKTSPPLPRRGFGKLWCNAADVQKEMGPIEREERLCQHSVTQRFDRGRLLACFEDATIRYFRLLDDGKWDMLMVQ